jgi:hypothetical protein
MAAYLYSLLNLVILDGDVSLVGKELKAYKGTADKDSSSLRGLKVHNFVNPSEGLLLAIKCRGATYFLHCHTTAVTHDKAIADLKDIRLVINKGKRKPSYNATYFSGQAILEDLRDLHGRIVEKILNFFGILGKNSILSLI